MLEVGSYKGELTSELLDWADGSGASIAGLDPEPPDELLELGKQRPELELVLETSHDALRGDRVPRRDRHRRRPQLLHAERGAADRSASALRGPRLPLLMFHDVGWPHARRDTYYVPGADPRGAPPAARPRRLPAPDRAGRRRGRWPAVRLGGRARGRSAERDAHGARGLRRTAARGCASPPCPAFFGFGVALAHGRALGRTPWPSVLEPWDRNPLSSASRPTGSPRSSSAHATWCAPGRSTTSSPGARRRRGIACARRRRRSASAPRGCRARRAPAAPAGRAASASQLARARPVRARVAAAAARAGGQSRRDQAGAGRRRRRRRQPSPATTRGSSAPRRERRRSGAAGGSRRWCAGAP